MLKQEAVRVISTSDVSMSPGARLDEEVQHGRTHPDLDLGQIVSCNVANRV